MIEVKKDLLEGDISIADSLDAYNKFCDTYKPRPNLGAGYPAASLGFDCWRNGEKFGYSRSREFTRTEILESDEMKALVKALEQSRRQVHKLWIMADKTRMESTFVDADDSLIQTDDALSNFRKRFGGEE